MTTSTDQSFFTGEPSARQEGQWRRLPEIDLDILKEARHYLAPPDLVEAVNVALELGMPLLLTGEPGSGKSGLADALAWELGFPFETASGGKLKSPVLKFTVKSDTDSRDLFYRFDTVGRFHAAQHEPDRTPEARRFISYHALGKAILLAKGKQPALEGLMREDDWAKMQTHGTRSIVLIDEIDKAPRQVPNDILTEIDEMSFAVPELMHFDPIELEGDEKQRRPIVIITSNSESDLPEAFLRRCIYYHLDLPAYTSDDPKAVSVERIVLERLGGRYRLDHAFVANAVSLFRHLRGQNLRKAPQIAELLSWVLFLAKHPEDAARTDPAAHSLFKASVRTTLLKYKEDQDRLTEVLDNWRKPKP